MSADTIRAADAALDAAIAGFAAAPLSRKKAMLAVLLADAALDARFAPVPEAQDILAFRAAAVAASDDLALVAAVAAQQAGGPILVLEAVEVPLGDYPRLSVVDFMVSLYNDHSVQRVRIALPDGTRRDALAVLCGAAAALREWEAKPAHG